MLEEFSKFFFYILKSGIRIVITDRVYIELALKRDNLINLSSFTVPSIYVFSKNLI